MVDQTKYCVAQNTNISQGFTNAIFIFSFGKKSAIFLEKHLLIDGQNIHQYAKLMASILSLMQIFEEECYLLYGLEFLIIMAIEYTSSPLLHKTAIHVPHSHQ
jgi:hypothetical protein